MLHLLLAMFDDTQSVTAKLAENNFFPEFVGSLFAGVLSGVAVRLKIDEWITTVVGCVAVIIGFIVHALISDNELSWFGWLVRAMPSIAMMAWIIALGYYRHITTNRVNSQQKTIDAIMAHIKSIDGIAESLEDDLSGKTEEIDKLRNAINDIPQFSPELYRKDDIKLRNPEKNKTVSIDDRESDPTNKTSDLTMQEIISYLNVSQNSLKLQQAERFKSMVVNWTCIIASVNDFGDNIDMTLKVIEVLPNNKYSQTIPPKLPPYVIVSLAKNENSHLNTCRRGIIVNITGRIYKIIVNPIKIYIDRASITFSRDNE